MGNTPSKEVPEPAITEKLAERLRAMQLEHEKDYMLIEKVGLAKTSSLHSDVSVSTTEKWLQDVLADPKNRLAISALSSNSLPSILTQQSTVLSDGQNFNIRIPHEGSPVTNQRSSGRCWLFASTNVFRVALMQRYNLEAFELSQAYLFFWDKLEKANYFLENILDTADEPLDGRLLQALLGSPVSDGGQWDMCANLVQKYGLVPHALYPDSYNAMNSSSMDRLITTKLREDAIRLRALASSASATSTDIAVAKEKMLREVHLILTLMLGPPPSPSKEFTWEYYDANNKFHSLTSTPLAFSSQLSDSKTVRAYKGTDVHKLFSLINDPRHAYMTHLTVSRLGNIWGGRPVTYINVPMSTMKHACIAMLKAGLPVFFGCDVGQSSDSARGIMDTRLFDYEAGFNVRLGMSKAERVMVGESAMTHAMVLTGVHVVDDKSVRWRVENSWSESAGSKGYFVMSDEWMSQFVYQAVVDPSFVGGGVRKVLQKKPEVLPLWDPMGALA